MCCTIGLGENQEHEEREATHLPAYLFQRRDGATASLKPQAQPKLSILDPTHHRRSSVSCLALLVRYGTVVSVTYLGALQCRRLLLFLLACFTFFSLPPLLFLSYPLTRGSIS